MNALQKAEQLDSFFWHVSKSPINARARASLSYVPVDSEPTPWLYGTEIVSMFPTAEAGMPHTRPPNLICLPQYYPESKKQETLIHEYIHIHQRNNKADWNELFVKEGWTPVQGNDIPPRWRDRCRLNPDTIDQPFWAWKGRYIPLPLFEREDKPDLRQIHVSWWDQETGVRHGTAPRLFLERYGNAPQPEHPRELSAVELAKVFQQPSDVDMYLRGSK